LQQYVIAAHKKQGCNDALAAFARQWCITVTIRGALRARDPTKLRVFAPDSLTLKGKGLQGSDVQKPSDSDFQAFLATAHTLADKAGAVILPHFRTAFAIDHKGGDFFDPVTAADRAAEAAIREALASAYPDHGIIGEEFGSIRSDAEYCWVIDPIDGTRSFILGLPLWGTLIGLTRGSVPLLGMMDQPFTGERFFASESKALFRHEGVTRSMRTRACPSLGEALLTTTTPEYFTGDDAQRFEALSRAVRLKRYGGDCYNYCMLALGQIDLVVEAGLQPYDILPLMPIVERAGGVVSAWDGGDPRGGGRIIAAGDSSLHAAAVKVLSR
jgi:histidinol phosphatase-like enzyme (inositol monophosphatase family)